MINTVSLKELRPRLPEVITRIDGKLDRYIVTRRGKPVVVILSVDDYKSLMETLDILADPEAMARIRKGEKEIRKRKTRSWKEVKAILAKLSHSS